MSEKQASSNKSLPLLFSEKSLLAAKYYSPHRDPFIGLVEGQLDPFVNKEHLNKAYQYLISNKTTFQLLFEKQEETFLKSLQTPAFKDIKEFKNKEAFLIWKNKALDFETGPLQEMVVYKTFFKTILCFKFHHLILDGFSLFLFFKELTEAYHKSLSGNLKAIPKADFKIYQQLMQDFFKQERENKEIKNNFWKKHLKTYQRDRSGEIWFSKDIKFKNKTQKTGFVEQKEKLFRDHTTKKGAESFFLKRKYLKKIYDFKSKENIGLFYLFASLYSKALKKSLEIDSICLRIPFSSRYHLKEKDQKNLLASLSRSLPLFINKPLQPLTDVALDLQTQARSVREYLIIDSSPWKGLKSFSKTKNQTLSLSMSYLPYTEQGFLGRIQNFYWQTSFLDLVLFVVLSEKRVLLSFSYKPELFSKKEIRALAKFFQQEIEKI